MKSWIIKTDKKGNKYIAPFPKNDPTIWDRLVKNKFPKKRKKK